MSNIATQIVVVVGGSTPRVVEVALPQGIQGPRGASILSGSNAPISSVGSNGDFYMHLQVINQDLGYNAAYLYGPKTDGTWPSNYVELKSADAGSLHISPLSFSQNIIGPTLQEAMQQLYNELRTSSQLIIDGGNF